MRRIAWFVAVVALGMTASATASAESLKSLVSRADLVFRGKTSAAVFEMEVITKSFKRRFKIVAWDDSRKGDKSLFKILGPASWRGHGTLKIGSKLKIYNPKTHHVQVVGASMLGSSWMGSHFSNDDLVKETRLARDYRLSLLKKWSAMAAIGGKATHYLIKMSPKPTAPVAWGRIEYELRENASGIVPVRSNYFRRASDKSAARTMRFTKLKKMAGRLIPSVMTVTLASKPGEHTRITYKKLKLNVKIPSAKFTEQALRR